MIAAPGAHTGSRIHVTTCQTYGEIMQRQSRDQRSLDTLQRHRRRSATVCSAPSR